MSVLADSVLHLRFWGSGVALPLLQLRLCVFLFAAPEVRAVFVIRLAARILLRIFWLEGRGLSLLLRPTRQRAF
jgi:hypothetical protein